MAIDRVEYHDRQYAIDGSWVAESHLLSMLFRVGTVTDDEWQSGEDYLHAYVAHHLAEHADEVVLSAPLDDGRNGRHGNLAALTLTYSPRDVEEIDTMTRAGSAYLAIEPLAAVRLSPQQRVERDIHEHALYPLARGISFAFPGFGKLQYRRHSPGA